MSQDTALTESYVKDHYNSGLRNMEEEYINKRWFSSVEARFDYMQTKRAIDKALGKENFEKAIEVGPGDGVWTREFAGRIKKLLLFDQSEEMIKRAKEALKKYSHIDYQIGNFATTDIGTALYDLFVSIRCFEYVIDKDAGVKKIADAVVPGGKVVIITKNPNYRSAKGWKPPVMHTEQIGKQDMTALLKKHGLKVDAVYPAVYRWKSSFVVFRGIFSVLQWLTLATNGRLYIPWLTDWSTESYTYVAHKDPTIVELYGMPGSGKTTLAKELEAQSGMVKRFRPQSWGSGLLYFICTQPGTFCFWMKEFFIASFKLNDWKFFRYRLAILLNTFEAVGQAYRVRAGVVVLEEGLVQRIVGTYEQKRSAEELSILLARIPKLHQLVVVEGGTQLFERYNHPENPRGQRGEAYMKQFKDMLQFSHTELLQAVHSSVVPTITYTRTNTPELLLEQLLGRKSIS